MSEQPPPSTPAFWRRVLVGGALVALGVLGAFGAVWRFALVNKEDERLTQRVKLVVDHKVPPEDAERVVGEQAVISTRKDRMEVSRWLHRTNWEEDGDQKIPDVEHAEHVLCWLRPVRKDDHPRRVRLVGVVWREKGEPELFYAIVFPP